MQIHRISLFLTLFASTAVAAPCTGGQSGGLDCLNTELLSRIPNTSVSANPGSAADVWGFTDLNSGREYTIVGYNNGTAVFDVTDPENPVEVGFIAGQNTSWRDIKVYQFFNAAEDRWNAFAYVVADSATDGLFVIDLTELPHRVFRSGAFNTVFQSAHNVFVTNIDYATGLALDHAAPSLIIAGSNIDGGRFRTYSLANPAVPQEISVASGAGFLYMHDAASTLITDSRKDQCQNETPDYCELLFDFNEGSFVTWDITNPAAPFMLQERSYSGVGYTHSGWVTEDQQFLFVNDELDERNFNTNTTVRVFSLANLNAPTFIGSWVSTNITTDHNGFVRGNRYYLSNYKRGLTILDITNPANPGAISEAGFLDTFSGLDNSGSPFQGAWGAYPFFPSGTIAISDIGNGLHMIRDNTLSVPQGTLSFVQASFAAIEGSDVTVTVQRSGGSSGAISVDYGLVPGTADASDLAAASGTLSWADGDTADKSITLSTLADGDATEGLELMRVKLLAPAGGATISPASNASVYISDGNTSSVEFDSGAIEVGEVGFAKAVIIVQRRDSAAGAVSVDYTVNGGDANAGIDYQGTTSGTLSWDDGDADPRWIEFPIVADGTVEPDEFFELMLLNATGASLGTTALTRVTILDADGNVPPPPPPPGGSFGSSSGGGTLGWLFLTLLGALALGRRTFFCAFTRKGVAE
jgi:choice-of-anchor B domain-containing protein